MGGGGHFEVEDERVHLRFKDCEVEIPSRVLEPYKLELAGVEFFTVPPMTLLHLYLIPGSLRSDDWSRSLRLARWIKENGDGGYSEDLYEGFHAFARKRQEMYPLHAFVWKMDRRRNVLGRPSAIRAVKRVPGASRVLRELRKRVMGILQI